VCSFARSHGSIHVFLFAAKEAHGYRAVTPNLARADNLSNEKTLNNVNFYMYKYLPYVDNIHI
jgi:hypothetical protein